MMPEDFFRVGQWLEHFSPTCLLINRLPDVVLKAQIALAAGKVTAMHDPTEGGLVTALWELAQASGRKLWFDPSAVPIPNLAAQVCRVFGLDPHRAMLTVRFCLREQNGSG
jgi:hydrogenase maturation factor